MNNKEYFDAIKDIEILSQEETNRLISEYQRTHDINIRNKIVEHNLRLVCYYANRVDSGYISYEELVSSGNIGLIKAIDKYDPSMECKFSTFVKYWIDKYMYDALYKNTHALSVGSSSTGYRVCRFKKRLAELLCEKELNYNSITPKLIAKEFDMNEENARILLRLALNPKYLSAPVLSSKSHETYADILENKDDISEELIGEYLMYQKALKLIDELDDIDRIIMYGIIGINGEPKTFRELASEVGCSRQNIHERYHRKLRYIRSKIA